MYIYKKKIQKEPTNMNQQPKNSENDQLNKILSLVRCELETVGQEKLVEFLASKPNFARAIMIRKGREIMRKDLVGIEEGPGGFLTDIFHPVFAVCPSRRCIVVKEDLLCNGDGSCRRKCGGIGSCIPDCPKKHERAKMGHRCSFKVLLTMHSDQIGTWEVKTIGCHIEPEDSWVPPVKKLRERKDQSKLLKLQRKKLIKNKPMTQFEHPLKQQLNPYILSTWKKNADLLIQGGLFDRHPDLLENNINTSVNILPPPDHNGVQIIDPPIKEAPLEFQSTENIPNFHNQDNIPEFPQSDQSKVLKLQRKKGIKNKPMSQNEHALKQELNPDIPSTCKKNADLLIQGGLFDRHPDLLENNINTSANILPPPDHNGVQIIDPPIKEAPLEFQNTENIPNFHNQDNILEFPQDAQHNLVDFQQPGNYEYLSDDGRGEAGGGGGGGIVMNNMDNMNFMTDNIVEDNRCLEEQILDFHRLEHQQKMQYLAEEHQARMEVISIEKDIALFKRQKLMNEIYAPSKCDNISLTEH